LGNRILVMVPDLEAVLSLEGVLRKLAANRDTVHVAVDHGFSPSDRVWRREAKALSVSLGPAPPLESRPWYPLAAAVRGCLDVLQPLDGPREVREWRRQSVLEGASSLARRLASSRLAMRPAVRRGFVRRLEEMAHALPVDATVLQFFGDQSPAMVILAPLTGADPSQVDYIRAARALGIGTFGYTTAWSDLVARGRLQDLPDCVGVWNRDQRREAIDLQGVPPQRTTVVGACGVTRFVDPSPGRSRAQAVREAGLDPANRVVVFAGGAGTTPASELAMFEEWHHVLRAQGSPHVREATVLVRPHPANEAAWRAAIQSVAPAMVIEASPPKDGLAARLRAADAMVVLDTSLIPAAAACGVPVLGLFSDRFAGVQYDLAAFQRRTGCPEWPVFAHTLDTHIQQLAEALGRVDDPMNPARVAARAWARPHGPVLSPGFIIAVRVVGEVAAYGQSAAKAADAGPVPGAALRTLAAAARALGADGWFRRSDAAAAGVLSPADGATRQTMVGRATRRMRRLGQRLAKRGRSDLRRLGQGAAKRSRRFVRRLGQGAARRGRGLVRWAAKVPGLPVQAIRRARYHLGTLRRRLRDR
jgi:hypothetical protein